MKFLRNEALKKYTSFRIGGPADYFCSPKDEQDLAEALRFAREKKIPVAIMGAGTNLLALDKGFRGLVVKLAGGFGRIKVKGRTIVAGAGVPLPQLVKISEKKGLSGLEFLAGIPGTVGGAVVMNAGAWGKEMSDHVTRVRVLDGKGKEKAVSNKGLNFGYRKSALQKSGEIVIEAVFRLRKGKVGAIKRKIRIYLEKRKAKQPLGIPNAGSIFKNPKGRFAGEMVEMAACKGMRVGDAQVSTKHANFIVNLGDAKAREVIKLISRIQSIVKKKFKIELVPELKVMVKSPR
jgi:UDP-N-acetylmuramate dehydrogenase